MPKKQIQQTDQQIKSVLTPEITKQLQDFLDPKTLMQPENLSDTPFQRLKRSMIHKTFTMEADQQRKINLLLSYTNISNQTKKIPEIKNIQAMYEIGFLTTLFITLLMPKKLMMKSFLGLGVVVFKNTFVDRIQAFQTASYFLKNGDKTQQVQQCRDVYQYYINKKLQLDASKDISSINTEGKILLRQFLAQIESDSKDYFLFKQRQHLL